jgi:hypothetical protein
MMTGEQLSRADFRKSKVDHGTCRFFRQSSPPVVRTQMHTYFENSTGRVAGPDPSISNVIPIL